MMMGGSPSGFGLSSNGRPRTSPMPQASALPCCCPQHSGPLAAEPLPYPLPLFSPLTCGHTKQSIKMSPSGPRHTPAKQPPALNQTKTPTGKPGALPTVLWTCARRIRR